MISPLFEPDFFAFDVEPLPVDTISLDVPLPSESDKTALEYAAQLSAANFGDDRPWQIYLEGLMIFAFQMWLAERSPSVVVDVNSATSLYPPAAQFIEAATHLRAGPFIVCLLPSTTVVDDWIEIPRPVVDLATYAAHFYVLVEVWEEEALARIAGFMPYSKLIELQNAEQLAVLPHWRYAVPRSQFDTNRDRLLLYLEGLESVAIPLPPASSSPPIAQQSAIAEDRWTSLVQPGQPLWSVLSWEEGRVLLECPDSLERLYNLQQGESRALERLSSSLNRVSHEVRSRTVKAVRGAINAAAWLRNSLDEAAAELNGTLLPVLTPVAPALRSPLTGTDITPERELQGILAQVQHADVVLPEYVHSAYWDCDLEEIPLRLYVSIWPLNPNDRVPEWSLLAVIGRRERGSLPLGLQLSIADDTQLLGEQRCEEVGEAFLYTCAIASWGEQLSINLQTASGARTSLPPFAFSPLTQP